MEDVDPEELELSGSFSYIILQVNIIEAPIQIYDYVYIIIKILTSEIKYYLLFSDDKKNKKIRTILQYLLCNRKWLYAGKLNINYSYL